MPSAIGYRRARLRGDCGQLRFALQRRDGRAIVGLTGELDLASVPLAGRALERTGGVDRDLVLDLSEVTFIDVCGLRFLLDVEQRAREANRRLVVRHPTRAVRRMLQLTDSEGLLCIEDSD